MLLHEEPFCWFCRTAITEPMADDPNDKAFIELTCRDCHDSHRNILSEIYIHGKTTIVVACQDWKVWTNYLALHEDQEIDCIAQHLSLASKAILELAVAETRIGVDIPEDEKNLSCFWLHPPEEYVIVTRRIEAALDVLTAAIRSGEVEAQDHQLEHVLGLDLGL